MFIIIELKLSLIIFMTEDVLISSLIYLSLVDVMTPF